MAVHPRYYLDTSVIGGCLDAEFAVESRRLLQSAVAGAATLIISDLLVREIQNAPPSVRQVLTALPRSALEPFATNLEAEQLQAAYMAAGVVGPKWSDDAQHVANATLVRADALVGWNFRHIVRVEKPMAYHAVNLAQGYPALEIRTPKEVVSP